MAPKGLRPSRPHWHLIYFILAAFDILTVSGSLYLNRKVMEIYSGSVDANRQWTVRLTRIQDLRKETIAVSQPGNDIFDTRNVDRERARRDAAMSKFLGQLNRTRREIVANVPLDAADPLLKDLSAVESSMASMIFESDLVFSYIRDGKPGVAGQKMARMDRLYAQINSGIDRAEDEALALQQNDLSDQIAQAAALRTYEYVIGGLIVLMVLFVTVYGLKMAREVRVAEKRKAALEAWLRQAQKMESLGTLAGGTAHEFNNILMPMMMATELAMLEIPEHSEAYANLTRVLESGKRAARLIERILAFSRSDKAEMEPVEMNALVDDSFALLRSSFPATITIRTNLTDGPLMVSADQALIQRAISNLASNAMDAMEGKTGELTVELWPHSSPAAAQRQADDPPQSARCARARKSAGAQPPLQTGAPSAGDCGQCGVHGACADRDRRWCHALCRQAAFRCARAVG